MVVTGTKIVIDPALSLQSTTGTVIICIYSWCLTIWILLSSLSACSWLLRHVPHVHFYPLSRVRRDLGSPREEEILD